MSLLKWSSKENTIPFFSNFFDDVFGREFYSTAAKGISMPAANIQENKKDYTLELAVPGLKKEDLKIQLDGNVLTISAEVKTEQEETDKKELKRKEFNFNSFERSFTLPDVVEPEHIKAVHDQGVLKLTIPKEEGATLSSKSIPIS